MGYDSTISVYNENGKYMGDIVDDISFRTIRNLIRFTRDKQLNEKAKNKVCLFGDIVCKVQVIKDFIYDCEKNGVINDEDYYWDVLFARKILENKRIKYFSITSV